MNQTDTPKLTPEEQAMLAGADGAASQTAMILLVRYARIVGATHLIKVAQAHIDGCLYHGQVSLDFVDRLVSQGGQVKVPTTLNVGSVDLIHPGLVKMPGKAAQEAADPRRQLMERHEKLGCEPSFTCAPYLNESRPQFGEQLAWGESNAVVFANSVIGARTNRYGDFLDLCCALTGCAPAYGLHLDEYRLGQMLFQLHADCTDLDPDTLSVGLGYLVGQRTNLHIPAIAGLPSLTEDQLKAFGAVAASSGSVGLFHVIGQTPEAPDHQTTFGGRAPLSTEIVRAADIRAAMQHLSTIDQGQPIEAVSLGTPHYSLEQLQRLAKAVEGWRPASGVKVYVNVGREIWARAQANGCAAVIEQSGVTVVLDTCVYVTTILDRSVKSIMTDSGKLAHYAPGNLGVQVAFGRLEDCLASASVGQVSRTHA